MIQRFIRPLAFLFFVSILALMLNLVWEVPTVAQMLPGLDWSDEEIARESHIPTFTRGNMEIAPVFLDGKFVGAVSSFADVGLQENTNAYSASIRSG